MGSSGPIDFAARHESFERWFQTPLGRGLLASQRGVLDRELEELSGARQLQVGLSHRLPLASGTDFIQKIITSPGWHPHMPDGVAVCDSEELPFPGDSMDLVILHHAADFSRDPHQVLRESARVLRGEGVMALIGFNPISLWGVRKMISRHRQGPWGGRFLLRSRMEDWLRLLGFALESSSTYFCTAPVQRRDGYGKAPLGSLSGHPNIIPVGAYYCILARKRVQAPIRRGVSWRKSKVMSLPGAVGASRGCANNTTSKTEIRRNPREY
ncbi:class I SAM-dependent methyltransferase [Marinobacter sp.]|uniref:class I SAM-dependent methyltransferase n=1 Tax=Marinobacter sp. TaxID=50741 RepID=UPI0035643949